MSEHVFIKGHIKNNSAETQGLSSFLTVLVCSNKQVLAKTATDSTGNFTIRFTKETGPFDFFCFGAGIDTILIESVNTFEKDSAELTFYIPNNNIRLTSSVK